MSRFFYVSLLFVMSLVGFGAVQSALAASPSVAGGQNDLIAGNNSLLPGKGRMWDWNPDHVHYSSRNAVAGIRG